jgi:hypothetical protein
MKVDWINWINRSKGSALPKHKKWRQKLATSVAEQRMRDPTRKRTGRSSTNPGHFVNVSEIPHVYPLHAVLVLKHLV